MHHCCNKAVATLIPGSAQSERGGLQSDDRAEQFIFDIAHGEARAGRATPDAKASPANAADAEDNDENSSQQPPHSWRRTTQEAAAARLAFERCGEIVAEATTQHPGAAAAQQRACGAGPETPLATTSPAATRRTPVCAAASSPEMECDGVNDGGEVVATQVATTCESAESADPTAVEDGSGGADDADTGASRRAVVDAPGAPAQPHAPEERGAEVQQPAQLASLEVEDSVNGVGGASGQTALSTLETVAGGGSAEILATQPQPRPQPRGADAAAAAAPPQAEDDAALQQGACSGDVAAARRLAAQLSTQAAADLAAMTQGTVHESPTQPPWVTHAVAAGVHRALPESVAFLGTIRESEFGSDPTTATTSNSNSRKQRSPRQPAAVPPPPPGCLQHAPAGGGAGAGASECPGEVPQAAPGVSAAAAAQPEPQASPVAGATTAAGADGGGGGPPREQGGAGALEPAVQDGAGSPGGTVRESDSDDDAVAAGGRRAVRGGAAVVRAPPKPGASAWTVPETATQGGQKRDDGDPSQKARRPRCAWPRVPVFSSRPSNQLILSMALPSL